MCWLSIISSAPSLYVKLRVATRIYDVEGGAIFSKNSTFVLFNGAAWTPRLWSPSPIMTPGNNLQPFNYSATNLLSCKTLDVENYHSTVHIKQANMSMMEYTRSFGITMKESVKRVTEWVAYYHISRKSWYPEPEETIPFSKVPLIKPLPIVNMSKENCHIMQDWASAYGAAV